MVTTHSEEEWRLLRSLRNQGRGDAGGWLEHVRLGFNYRLDRHRRRDRDRASSRSSTRSSRSGPRSPRDTESCSAASTAIELPCADDADHERSWFVYVVKLADNETRERVIAHFEREGIGYNRYLPSIHLQPYMRERYGFSEGLCPVSEDASARTLALPFFTALGARARRSGSPRRSRPSSDGAAIGRRRGAVHDEGRLDDSRTAPHAGAEPGRGDARAGPGDEPPLPPGERGDLLRAQGLRARWRSTATRVACVPATPS